MALLRQAFDRTGRAGVWPWKSPRGAHFRSRDGRSEYRRGFRLGRRGLLRHDGLYRKPMLRGEWHSMGKQFHRECARTMAASCLAAIAVFLLSVIRCGPVRAFAFSGCGRSGARDVMGKCNLRHTVWPAGHSRGHLAGLPQRRPAVEAESHDQQATQCENGPSHEPGKLSPRGMANLIPRQNFACQ